MRPDTASGLLRASHPASSPTPKPAGTPVCPDAATASLPFCVTQHTLLGRYRGLGTMHMGSCERMAAKSGGMGRALTRRETGARNQGARWMDGWMDMDGLDVATGTKKLQVTAATIRNAASHGACLTQRRKSCFRAKRARDNPRSLRQLLSLCSL
ncbi:hypothetical protein LY76DRAFT_201983 [Colletotrichum caudatum]|nr:hypothetical protein LY76DRAFT_201983 [Colletotrichum caudatum]